MAWYHSNAKTLVTVERYNTNNAYAQPTLLLSFFAATGTYWILSGQHTFCACLDVRKAAVEKQQESPQWARTFRCRVIKPETDIAILRKISGGMQAKHRTVQSMTFAQAIDYFYHMAKVVGFGINMGFDCFVLQWYWNRLHWDSIGMGWQLNGWHWHGMGMVGMGWVWMALAWDG